MSYLSSQSGPQSLMRAAVAQQQTRWASSATPPWSAASASGGTSVQAPGGPGGMVREFSTGYDLWADSPLGAELYKESVSPLATKILNQEAKEGIHPRTGGSNSLSGTHPDYIHYTSEPRFQPNVGSNRVTNFPGPLYRADAQTLETKLKQRNQTKWDEMNVPQVPGLPEPGNYKHNPIDSFISQVTDFISRKPAMSALIFLVAYTALK